jgi:hypothetical protein
MTRATLSILVLAALASAPAVSAEDRFELTAFGGVSLLDAAADRVLPIYCWLPPLPPDGPVPFDARVPNGSSSSVPVPPGFTVPCPQMNLRQAIGASFLHGTALSYRVTTRASIEAVFSVAPSHDIEASFGPYGPSDLEWSVVAYHIDLAVRYELTTGDTRPFVSFGFGRIEYGGDAEERLGFGISHDRDFPADRGGEWALNVGAGVSLKLAERLRGRVEVVDHILTDHFITGEAEHDVHVRMGVSVRP